ncbi:MAG: NAD(P)-binding domain-containing protein [Candidatus Manganitrophus sp.]|nr:NAD(P)-binding domain-containing protein [Candidatus Manganitrophus sp.]
MQIGFIGLGRMGANMVQRLAEGGHVVVGYDRSPDAVQQITRHGAAGATSLAGYRQAFEAPRHLIMVPAGEPVTETINALLSSLSPGDILIDGGNSYYKDAIRRAEDSKKRNFLSRRRDQRWDLGSFDRLLLDDRRGGRKFQKA